MGLDAISGFSQDMILWLTIGIRQYKFFESRSNILPARFEGFLVQHRYLIKVWIVSEWHKLSCGTSDWASLKKSKYITKCPGLKIGT